MTEAWIRNCIQQYNSYNNINNIIKKHQEWLTIWSMWKYILGNDEYWASWISDMYSCFFTSANCRKLYDVKYKSTSCLRVIRNTWDNNSINLLNYAWILAIWKIATNKIILINEKLLFPVPHRLVHSRQRDTWLIQNLF